MPCSYSGISSSVFELLCTNGQGIGALYRRMLLDGKTIMWEWLSGLEEAVNVLAESIMSYVSDDVARTDDYIYSNCLFHSQVAAERQWP